MKLGEEYINASMCHGTHDTDSIFNSIKEFLPQDLINEFNSCTDDESKSMMLNEQIWDYMNEIAPEGCYFGASEGDGSDFGFWEYKEEPHSTFKVPHVMNLNKEDFKVIWYRDGFWVSKFLSYKNIPMIRMGVELDEVDIFVIGGDEYDGNKEPFTIAVQDHEFNDIYTYGTWDTLDEVKTWLENPVQLY